MWVHITEWRAHLQLAHMTASPLQMLDEFVWSWVEYDLEGRGTIDPRHLGHVLRDTAPPLGVGPDATDVSEPT